jgi:predicted Zn-dependent peptidase
MPPPPVTRESQRVTASLGGQMAAIRIGSLMQVAAPDRRPLELLIAILSNRMGMTLREQQGLSYSVGASYDPMPGGHAEFQAWLNPPRERLAEGQRALLEFVAGFDAETITQDELTKTRSALVGRLMMRRLASISQAYYLAMAELDGDLSSYHRMLTAYDAVDLADLRRVGERYFDTMQMVSVVVD